MDKLDEALAQVDSLLNEYEANLPQQFDPGSFVADTAIRVNGTIASVTKDESGNVVIVDASGTRTTVPAGTSAAITDSAGNGYIVDKKGNIHSTTAEIAAKAGNREYNLALKFDASPNQAFGFDVKHNPLAVKYERLEGDKYASWKSVATGRTDAVLAILEGTGFDKSKIRFEQAGVGIGHQASATTSMPNAFDLNVRGGADGIEEGLLALYTPPDTTQKEQVLGKMNVATYDEIQKTVIIVPVNGNKYPYSEANLRTQLNKIYGQAVVKWNVQMAPEGFVVPGIDPFDDGGSGLLSNYSPDMRKVVDAYSTDPAPDTYYLFLVKNPKAGKLAGYMPRSKEFGFIFTDQNGSEQAIIHTMAHELGHGAFNLRHTFDEEKYTMEPEGSTDNLMDYTPTFGTKLYKHQWDQMRYPEIVVGLFEKDEDAASLDLLSTTSIAKSQLPCSKCMFLSPAGKPFLLEGIEEVKILRTSQAGMRSGELPEFAVYGYKLENGKSAFALVQGSVFLGFQLTETSFDVFPQTFENLNPPVEIVLAKPIGEPFWVQKIEDPLWFSYGGEKSDYKADGYLQPTPPVFSGSKFTPLNSFALEERIEATKTTRNSEYDSDLKKFQEKLRIVLAADVCTKLDENIADPSLIARIEEKLQAYAYVNEGKKKIVFISGRVNYFIQPAEWDEFASLIANGIPEFNSETHSLVILPYALSETPGMTGSQLNVETIAHVYAGYTGLNKFNVREIVNLDSFFLAYFTSVPKPYVVHSYTLDLMGGLSYLRSKSSQDITGLDHVYDLYMFVDESIDIAEQRWKYETDLPPGNLTSYQVQLKLNAATKYFDLLSNTRTQRNYKRVELPIIVWEKFIESYHDEIVNNFIIDNYRGLAGYSSLQNAFIENAALKEPTDYVLVVIDVGSFLAAFVGADVIFDLAGAYYSLEKGYLLQSAAYTAAATIPFITGPAARQVVVVSKQTVSSIGVYAGQLLSEQLARAFKISDGRLGKLLSQPRAVSLIEQNPSLLSEVSILPIASKNQLLDDLIESAELMETLSTQPKLLTVWEKIYKSQVNQEIRKNPEVIKRLEKLNCTL
ncbi:MAG: hypothetical protein ACK5ZY_11560 [Cyclobacteriaceae bacterium]